MIDYTTYNLSTLLLDINSINLTQNSSTYPPTATLDIKATNSTWDELIEMMYLRFLVKSSYAGTCRLFFMSVRTDQSTI